MTVESLSKAEKQRLSRRRNTHCDQLGRKIASVADYVSVLSVAFSGDDLFWFRGLSDIGHQLIPSALRHEKPEARARHLDLLRAFQRVAEVKLGRPAPKPDDTLKWMQLAQHYGLGTRLLDWSESATVGLYFACAGAVSEGEKPGDAVVFVLRPRSLNQSSAGIGQVLEGHQDSSILEPYIDPSPRRRARGPVAVHPVWNSERIMAQKGAFTLHPEREPELTKENAPGLVAIPILGEYRIPLLRELGRIGVDEMMLFPELEHACNHLKWEAGLS